MSGLTTLEKVIALAVERHAGQRDKAGEPYILHPLRLMLRMPDQASRIAAVLHDVVGDSGTTLEELAAPTCVGCGRTALRASSSEPTSSTTPTRP